MEEPQINEDKIKVNLDFLGPWDLPFITKKIQTVELPQKSTVDTLIKSLIAKYGEEFAKIASFATAVINGKMVTHSERKSIELKNGDWVRFVFGVDGG